MTDISLYGSRSSVYVRIVRLVLEELRAPYTLVEFDIFAKAGVPPRYGELHPFNKVPALDHDGFRLFETDAIVAYVIDVFGGQRLIADTVRERARAVQLMRVMDNYVYPRLVWAVYVEEVERGKAGQLTDTALELAGQTLTVVETLVVADPYLVGAQLTLADLWALPMLEYFARAPSGAALMAATQRLGPWLERMQGLASVNRTRFEGKSDDP